MKARTRTSLKEDLVDLYDDLAIGWNELFEEPSPTGNGRRPTQTSDTSGPTLPTDRAKGRGRKVYVPPYLRIGGGKRSSLERAMKERLLEQPKQSKKESKKEMGGSNSGDLEEAKKEHFLQPFPRLRKPAEVVEAELDQLRMRLQKELREGRKEARRRRQMRRRCRLQEGEDLAELETQWKLEKLEITRSERQKESTRSFFSQLGQKRLVESGIPPSPRVALTAR